MSGPEEFDILIPYVPEEASIESKVEKKEINQELYESKKELLIAAREKDPNLREKLVKWINDTSIPEANEREYDSWERLDIAIMHATATYSCGFFSKEEVLDELEMIGLGMTAEMEEDSAYTNLLKLVDDIKDDKFNLYDIGEEPTS